MPSQSQTPPEVFISYSHQDSEYKEHLVKQLEVLAEQKIISQWHDGLLVAGERWNDEIVRRLKSSRVMLFLISVDSLTSLYINDVELKETGERYQAGEITVIPILVRTVHGWKKKPFGDLKLGELQALPRNGKFIKGGGDLDEAFSDIAAGIQETVEKLKPINATRISPPSAIPTSHQTDYVKRHDEQGRDMLERLRTLLAPQKKGPVALWGKGGTGKTRIASEAASALTAEFGQRIVWASAEKRADFTFSTLLDEIAAQLGAPEVLKLVQEPKEEAVCERLAQSPTLLVLDNFETVATDERARCISFLAERANCPSLITSRLKAPAPTRNIPIKGMSNKEAQEFLDQLVEQTQDSRIFARQVRSRIIKTGESNPYIMLWMVAQIDEAQTPKKVLDELEHGKGPVAERVFDRSFNLEVVGEDGRAVLLALSLFVPDASREALAEIAGLAGDLARVDEATKNLRMLWLIEATQENERLSVSGLTRSQMSARLARDAKSDKYRRRFVAYFLAYVEAHAHRTPEDFDALEVEKDNLLGAIDRASEIKDWNVLQRIAYLLVMPPSGILAVHGYWAEALLRGQEALDIAKTTNSEWYIGAFANGLGTIFLWLGNHELAKEHFQLAVEIARSLKAEQGLAASLHQLGRLAPNQGELDESRRLYDESLEINKRLGDQHGIGNTLHNLAAIAQDQGELDEARRLYNESLEIEKKLGTQSGIAISLHQLARLAQDLGELDEARRLYYESLEIKRALGNQSGIASTTSQLGIVHRLLGESAESQAKHEESLAIRRKIGDQQGIAIDLHQLAMLAQDRGERDEARRLYNESLEIKKKLSNQSGIAISLHELAILAQVQGELDEAQRLYNESLEISKKLGVQSSIGASLHQLGTLAEEQGRDAEAAQLFSEALAILERLKSPNAEMARENLERVQGKSS